MKMMGCDFQTTKKVRKWLIETNNLISLT